SLTHCGRSLPSLCWHALACYRPPPAATRASSMTQSPSVSRWLTRQSSGLVRVLTEQLAFVYLPPGSLLVPSAAGGQTQPPRLPPAFVRPLLPLLARALPRCVAIGRTGQTR